MLAQVIPIPVRYRRQPTRTDEVLSAVSSALATASAWQPLPWPLRAVRVVVDVVREVRR